MSPQPMMPIPVVVIVGQILPLKCCSAALDRLGRAVLRRSDPGAEDRHGLEVHRQVKKRMKRLASLEMMQELFGNGRATRRRRLAGLNLARGLCALLPPDFNLVAVDGDRPCGSAECDER